MQVSMNKLSEPTAVANPPYAVQMEDIVVRFPGVLANDNVSFDLRQGEIHALLGENGAGKSTLMNALAGLYKPTSGTIKINGQPVTLNSPRDAIAHGIGMVHQHFMLVPNQTVTENILLGLDKPGFFVNLKKNVLHEKVGYWVTKLVLFLVHDFNHFFC